MSSFKQRLGALLAGLDRAVDKIESTVLAGGVLLMAVISIINVAGRNLMGESLPGAEELNQVLMVLITFLGIGYGVRHARHIRMSALYDSLKGRPRKALLVISSLGTGILLFILAWYAVEYVDSVYRIGSVTPALQIPLYLIYLWVPIGLVMGGLQYLLAVYRNLTTPGIHLSFQQEESYEAPCGPE